MTPAEQAVIAAAEKWREYENRPMERKVAPVRDLAAAVDALRESRKQWRVEENDRLLLDPTAWRWVVQECPDGYQNYIRCWSESVARDVADALNAAAEAAK